MLYTSSYKVKFFQNILHGEKSKNVNARFLTHHLALLFLNETLNIMIITQ